MNRRAAALAVLGGFLAVSLGLALAPPFQYLVALVAVLAILALVLGLPRGAGKLLAWILLMPLPATSFLFILAGRETTGAWGPGAALGLLQLAAYTLRLGGLLLANLLFLQAVPLPDLLSALRALPIPEPAALFLAAVLRFLPTTLREARRVVEAQRCRGLARRRMFTPAGFLSLAVPLFLAQIQKSHDLALSLEIRCGAASRRPGQAPANPGSSIALPALAGSPASGRGGAGDRPRTPPPA